MDDAVLGKIRKLHALAESPGNEAEAAVAASRVQELLARHNLEIGEVVLKQDPGTTAEVGRAWNRIPVYATVVAGACNEMFDVLNYFGGSRYDGWRFVFIGLNANVEAAAITYEYLMESIEALARGAKTQGLIYGSEEFLAFRCGAGNRIHDMARARKAQTLAANPGYEQLVHIGNALAQDMYGAIKFKGSRGGGFAGWMSIETEAYSHGYAQGGGVDLTGARTSRMLK